MSNETATGTDERVNEMSSFRNALIRPELGGIIGTVAVFAVFIFLAGDSGMFTPASYSGRMPDSAGGLVIFGPSREPDAAGGREKPQRCYLGSVGLSKHPLEDLAGRIVWDLVDEYD